MSLKCEFTYQNSRKIPGIKLLSVMKDTSKVIRVGYAKPDIGCAYIPPEMGLRL